MSRRRGSCGHAGALLPVRPLRPALSKPRGDHFNAVRATAFFSSPAQILQLRMTAAATLTVSQLGTSLGPRMVRARGDQDAVTVKVTMKQPRLRPALATSSHVPGTGMGIPDG